MAFKCNCRNCTLIHGIQLYAHARFDDLDLDARSQLVAEAEETQFSN